MVRTQGDNFYFTNVSFYSVNLSN